MMSHFAYRQKEAYLAITYMNNSINSQYPLLYSHAMFYLKKKKLPRTKILIRVLSRKVCFGGRKYSQVYRGDDTKKEANNRAKGAPLG